MKSRQTKRILDINMEEKNGSHGRIVAITLSVVGAFLSIGMVVNAFFIQDLLAGINEVQKQNATLIERTNHVNFRLDTHEKRIEKLEGK